MAIMLFTGCQKDPDVCPTTQSAQSLVVSLPSDDTASRVEFADGESKVTLSWEEGDVFAVYDSNEEYVADFKFLEFDNNSKATFISTDSNITLANNSKYIAIYPTIDDPTTLTAHREELASRLAEQTQNGNSDNSHLNDALRMEAAFTYSSSQNTIVAFEHKLAIVRIAFAYDGSIPSKVVFSDGDVSYTLNFEEVTETSVYTSYFVIEPNLASESRDVTFKVYGDDNDKKPSNFSATTSATYIAGIQYRLTLALSDVSKWIYDKDDLIEFRNLVNNGISDISAILMDDIDLDNETWTPIGTSSSIYYSGTFDGGGHTISNLSINNSSDYQGLFGYVKGGAINDVILDNPQVAGGEYTGAVCGYMTSLSSISGCGVVNGSVSGSDDVGGVVGCAYSFNSSSSVTACYNTGSVSGSDDVGGVVGDATSSTVTACYNTGSVSGSSRVGGVVGDAYSTTVTACYYISTLTPTYGSNVKTLSELNAVVSTMNSAAGEDYFTTNSGNILPSLFDEQITYENLYVENMSISSLDDLKTFRDLVNIGFSPQTATLTANIDLNNKEWTPIGISPTIYFNGTFDGGGHTISNLSINNSSDYQGLFGYVKGGAINDVILDNPQVAGGEYTGAVCGYMTSSSSISGCGVVNGSVSGSDDVGGVVGCAYSFNSSSSVTACYNTGSISGSSSVGGVVGYVRYSSSVTACYNTGSVSGSDDYVGGVVGRSSSSSSVTACYNTGSVSGSGDYVGGVVGDIGYYSSVTTCYNTGSVSGSSRVGGVVGHVEYSSVTACYNTGSVSGSGDYVGGVVGGAYSTTVTACYYISTLTPTYGSNVKTLSELNAVVSTMNSAAGEDYFTTNSGNILPSLFGEQITYEYTYIESMTINSLVDLKAFRDLVNAGLSPLTATLTANIDLNNEEWTPIGISSSYAFAGAFDGGGHTISNLSINSSNDYQGLFGYVKGGTIKDVILDNPQVAGGEYTGAVCGYMTSSSSISGCGVVNGSVSGSDDYVGGVVGYVRYSSSVTACYNTGSVSGSYRVGGVVGYANSSTVTACYNTGSVSGSYRVGGVVGYANSSSVTACYNTGSVEGRSDVGGVVGDTSHYPYITACYNTGSVSGSGDVGGVVGDTSHSPYITACYYYPYRTSYNSYGTYSSTLISTMKSPTFPTTLNTAAEDDYFEYDTYNYNDGYPILTSIDYNLN